MISPKLIISISIIAIALISVVLKKIDVKGAITGAALAFIIWLGAGEVCLLALFTFFILGTLATSWKKNQKVQLKLEQENDGKRSIRNVLANGGVAGILSFLAFILPDYHFNLYVMVLSAFASATSDTMSSELGNIYGKNFFNITTFKAASRGNDGVVSIQGFSFGAIGSGIIALLPVFFHPDWRLFLTVSTAGFSGNIMDSILGATLQQKGKLSNHDVNFWSTTFAAFFGLMLSQILKIS